jgi:hypothetical protein
MQHQPNTRTVQASTVPDENESVLVETADGFMIAPRWLADVIERVTDRSLSRVRKHYVSPNHPSLWDVTS